MTDDDTADDAVGVAVGLSEGVALLETVAVDENDCASEGVALSDDDSDRENDEVVDGGGDEDAEDEKALSAPIPRDGHTASPLNTAPDGGGTRGAPPTPSHDNDDALNAYMPRAPVRNTSSPSADTAVAVYAVSMGAGEYAGD